MANSFNVVTNEASDVWRADLSEFLKSKMDYLAKLETGPSQEVVRVVLNAIAKSEPRLSHALTNMPLHIRLKCLEEAVVEVEMFMQDTNLLGVE